MTEQYCNTRGAIHPESLIQQVFRILDNNGNLKPQKMCELLHIVYSRKIGKTMNTYKTLWKTAHTIKTDYAEEYGRDRNLKTLTIEESAYIAGIVDGEGCLRVARRKASASKSGWSFDVRLVITNTNSALMYWLENKIGGYLWGKAKRKPNEKPIFSLSLSSNGCRWLLPQIERFSIVKRGEIVVCTRALELLRTGKPQSFEELSSLGAEIVKIHGGGKGARHV